MTRSNPARTAIAEAIALVQRNEMPLTIKNVRANVDLDGLTLGDATDALRRYVNAQIPLMLKEDGHIIVDTETRVRRDFWDARPDELEAQARIKEESNTYDRKRLAADRAVIAFLREKEIEFGYEVYPGLFHSEVDRIYSMHGISPPKDGVAA